MVASVLRGVDVLFGPHLALWASDVHAIGLSFLGIAWIWPWLAKVFRWRAHAPEIEWVRLWRCPQCNTFNRGTFAACSHCDYKLREGGWKDWIPSSISEKMKRSGGQILSLYKACCWMVFYGLTGLAFWALRFYSFRQDPLQELLASVTVALLLLSLLFFHRAFR